jgi:hypothetical protein
MSDIDKVLERLVDDVSFRDEIRLDPQAALAGYDLTTEDLRVLAARVTGDSSQATPVEQRTSRSALFALLSRETREETQREERRHS